jgi:hypothetical protein
VSDPYHEIVLVKLVRFEQDALRREDHLIFLEAIHSFPLDNGGSMGEDERKEIEEMQRT